MQSPDLSTLIRALLDSGYVTPTIALVIVLVLTSLTRFLIRGLPALIQAITRHIAVRAALRAAKRCDQEHTRQVLEILHREESEANPLPRNRKPPPGPPT